LLEFNSQDGWEPLCKYLGKEVPEEPYPHINDADSTIAIHRFIWRIALLTAAKAVVMKWILPGGAVAAAWWYYRSYC
jgi:hypothetical protein